MPRRSIRPRPIWDAVTFEQQLELIDRIGNDGHTIWNLSASCFTPIIVHHFARRYDSHPEGGPSTTIYVGPADRPVGHLDGIYGLEVLESLANYHNVTSHALGRGFRARELTDGIRRAIQARPTNWKVP